MFHGRVVIPLLFSVPHPRLIELRIPFGNLQLAVLERQQLLEVIGTAVRRQPHHLAALVPIGEDVARDAAVERAETVHVEEFVAEQSAARLQPYLLQRFERAAFELVVALGFARERIDAFRQLPRLLDCLLYTSDAADEEDSV